MSSLCWECKYEHSDCKGNKQNDCPNFSENGAINYPKKIRELKNEINGLELQLNLGGELCEVFRNEINRLKAALKQADEALQIADRLEQAEKKGFGISEARIDLMPTIDIVHCKECKYYDGSYCDGYNHDEYGDRRFVDDNYFCGDGKRKE